MTPGRLRADMQRESRKLADRADGYRLARERDLAKAATEAAYALALAHNALQRLDALEAASSGDVN